MSYLQRRNYDTFDLLADNPPPHKPGSVAIYVWNNFCSSNVSILKGLAGYPEHPDANYFSNTLVFSQNTKGIGRRCFGYIAPNVSGIYRFAIANDVTSGFEMWLSSTHDPRYVEIILQASPREFIQTQKHEIDSQVFEDQFSVSKNISFMANGLYYFEIMIATDRIQQDFSVYWSTPLNLDFELIDGDFLAQPTSNEIIVSKLPCHKYFTPFSGIPDPRKSIPLLEPLPHTLYSSAFPVCEYRPSYLIPRNIPRYSGRNLVFETAVYLFNSTKFIPDILHGAPTIKSSEVFEIFDIFLLTLNNSLFDSFLNIEFLYAEKTPDLIKGNRYLIEAKVELTKYPSREFLISQYVYRFNTCPNTLCVPFLLPNEPPIVHFIIIVKNQSRWIRYFIQNMQDIYHITGDNRFGVTIVDFNSTDINISDYMSSMLTIREYTYLPVLGDFNKVIGQNLAIQRISHSNDIIFTCDLHLDIPYTIIEMIRKHTMKGVSAFAPMLRRLNCGVTLSNEQGFWEGQGYGLFSMFKSDWDIVGGMNSKEFGLEWGGEDWDLVDRVLSKGYEINRLRVPGLVHFYHSRMGSWYKYYSSKKEVVLPNIFRLIRPSIREKFSKFFKRLWN